MTKLATTGPVLARLNAEPVDIYVETQDTQGSPEPVRVLVLRILDTERGTVLGSVALGAGEALGLAGLLTAGANLPSA